MSLKPGNQRRPAGPLRPGVLPGSLLLGVRGLVLLCLIGLGAAGQPAPKSPASGRAWSPELLRDASGWTPTAAASGVAVSGQGVRVEVTIGTTFNIAAAAALILPADTGRVRIRVAEVGGGATWFVRLYGTLWRPGSEDTVSVAEKEAAAGERVVDVDPRMAIGRLPLQLQLGVEGKPGAYALFGDVAFLPTPVRPNRQRRGPHQPGQTDLAAVEWMPNLPEPFELVDWRTRARDYDRLVFDFGAQGKYLPLIALQDASPNTGRPVVALPSYVGDPRGAERLAGAQEGITFMGAVLGATLVGIDKSRQAHDYVAMCESWYNTKNGLDLVLNLQEQETGGSYWYEIWPHIVFYALADRYPTQPRLEQIMRATAERWRQVCVDLAGPDGVPVFEHTAFDFRARKPVDNGKWREPDAAAGIAWLQYAAWRRFGRPESLQAAERCVRSLEQRQACPYYEVLLPYGALIAARLSAEQGQSHDVERLLNGCFGISDCRGGWGVVLGNWGGYDCDGLVGSVDNRGGYAFALNTFAQAGALVPVARYEPRFARALGKWMLNLTHAARWFYPGALPPGHESGEPWDGDSGHVVAYEGLRREWQGKSPCATGDPVTLGWGPQTDLGLYGSSYVGMLGAIVRPTTVPAILQLDCLATDFFRAPAYPTFLYFNPYAEARAVGVDVGPLPVDLYDAVAKAFVARAVVGQTTLSLAADAAAVIVRCPAGGTVTRDGRRTLVNDIVVDYGTAP